jgi:transketolase
MRNTFVRTLHAAAEKRKDIYLITGDLGYGVLTKFWEDYPDRFLNAGISEQNMTSVAAGLALEGKTVFTYSIANFPTLRCLEQIRNDVAYHNANVKIVSVGAGFAYGAAGMSHHATEDLAVMRALPNLTIFSPADPFEAAAATRAALETDGPCYLRLGKGGEPPLHEEEPEQVLGRALPLLAGTRVCIFATGAITAEAKKAAFALREDGVSPSLYSVPSIKPLDVETIARCARETELIVTVEEHNILGGLGGAVAETLAGLPGRSARLVRIGLQDCYSSIVGSQAYLRECYGMSAGQIRARVLAELGGGAV